jgi:cellulose synthase/poly-beta-1,6-N-acetylglucosamine synthase-like glycosyltransferase
MAVFVEVKYSFIIPTVGNRENIFKIIVAISESGLENYEIIVVLQITANTQKVIKDCLENLNDIILVTTREFASTSLARNNGAEMSQGKILCFIDDDVFPTETLFKFLADIDNASAKILFPEIKNSEYIPFPLGDHVGGRGFFSACFIIEREEYLRIGGMSGRLSLFRDDSEFYIRAVKNGIKLEIIQDVYVWHPVRFTTSKTIQQMFRKQKLEPLFHNLVSGRYAGVLYAKPYNFLANRYGFSVASYFLITSVILIVIAAFTEPSILIVSILVYVGLSTIPSAMYFKNPRVFLTRKSSRLLIKISIYLIIFPVFILARIIGSIRYRHFTL